MPPKKGIVKSVKKSNQPKVKPDIEKTMQIQPIKNVNCDNFTCKKCFSFLTNDGQNMNADQYSNFITQMLKLPQDDILQFYILTNGIQCTKLDVISQKQFQLLFKKCGNAKKFKTVKDYVPKLRKQFNQQANFADMYGKIFDIFLQKGVKLNFESAQFLWSALLREKFAYYKEFMSYIQKIREKNQKIGRDLWNMVYYLTKKVKNLEKDFDPSEAWPIFIEDFVLFIKNGCQ